MKSLFVAIKHPEFLRTQSVYEEGRVRCNHQLRFLGSLAAFLGQKRQKARVEVVLRFFNTHQLRRVGVVENGEVGE
jgi:hypothetical protein